MLLKKIFKFDAAHNLTKYHGKCERLHGHTYKLVVTVKGKLDEQDMVIDFALLKDIVQKEVIDILDHAYLNDIIENPTAENIAKWIWQRLYDKIKAQNSTLYEVEVWETEDSGAVYRGEDDD
ncbi:6-pyruvoyl tetrahydropterin synthase and hypothetical protein [Caldicellulosiruptor saccharolyticus DSM 8903]|uniref:6-carboxy-5,6,7,8-tetrahydropterin synthase n=1 Tax=Caldicellulosiruptor saccharolyticus (strain ATCC 43494 / DSM 8903 / Tp8T 6331) TaxID=351627 RepID=A4XG23_CALS8|nr:MULTISPECIES: 6-carboxytetrahydropterin synthase QueD [Caldicellulosiruptor]ABP65858.1 6-pyruvoyl tetrahydropterin synthase and hypothetical protein [Caldicellulosiruptor saccharolyticus DSM 8903]